jgi:benzoate/toluate 1,2-dioxygenase subunit beta
MTQAVASISREAAESFLYHEAILIDERRFDEWLNLFSDDCCYWIPANKYDADTQREVSLVYDLRPRLEDRVYRLQLPSILSQKPASRTVHMISNVQVSDSTGDVLLRSCFAIHHLREGDWRQVGLGADSMGPLAGRYEHLLKSTRDGWKIRQKKVLLLQNNVPVGNISFLL